LPALFTVLSVVFDVNFVQLGLLMTVFSITNALFQIPCGYVVDRYGPKWILVAGILVDAAAFAACAIAPNYVTLLILMLAAGAGQAVFHPADYAILSALFPKERSGKTYAVHTFMGFSGGAAAPAIVAGLASIFNWQVALVATSLVGGVVGVLVAILMHAPERVPAAAVTGAARKRRLAGVGSMLSRTLLLLFGFYIFSSMFMSGAQSFLPSTLTALFEMPNNTANLLLTTLLAAMAFGVLIGGVFADRIEDQSRLVAGCMLAGTIFMVLIALFRLPVWSLFILLAAAGLVQGAISPSRDKLVRDAAPEGSTGTSFGFVSVGLSVGGIISPLLLGAFLDHGDAVIVFWSLAAFTLIAMVMVLIPGTPAAASTPDDAGHGPAAATARPGAGARGR
jgi:MFS family permease